MKDRRKYSTAKLLNKLKHLLQLNMLWFFSDDKNFCRDHMVNSQNNCWIALSKQDVLIGIKIKLSVHIKVFVLITSDGDIMLPFNFHKASDSKQSPKEVMLPKIERVAAGRPYIWQQDSALCCTSRRIQSWLCENFCNHITPNIWQPNSPGCHSLDYVLCERPTKLCASPKMNWKQE